MSGNWSVRKRDGVWQAFDREGDARYASSDWWSVLTFACLGAAEPEPDTYRQRAPEFYQALRRMWLKRFMDDDQ